MEAPGHEVDEAIKAYDEFNRAFHPSTPAKIYLVISIMIV
jgi:hypothetical protein